MALVAIKNLGQRSIITKQSYYDMALLLSRVRSYRVVSLRVSPCRAFGAAAAPESYYDSQSGLWVAKAQGLRLHELALTRSIDARAFASFKASRATSVELPPDSLSEIADVARLEIPIAMKIHDLGDLSSLPPAVRIAVLDVDVASTSANAWASQLSLVAAASARGLAVRANFSNALTADPSRCQLAGGKFADAGCGALVLLCSDAEDDEAEDALEAAIEALLWVDVAGETMLSRLAMRAPHSPLGERLVRLAGGRFGVTAFDVDATSSAEPAAMPASALLRALAAAGADIGGRDPAACEAAEVSRLA